MLLLLSGSERGGLRAFRRSNGGGCRCGERGGELESLLLVPRTQVIELGTALLQLLRQPLSAAAGLARAPGLCLGPRRRALQSRHGLPQPARDFILLARLGF